MFDHDLGHLCRGKRLQKSGHSDFTILSNLGAPSNFSRVQADTASAACPSQSGGLAMTCITFAAVIWDADDPCSVNTAYDPGSSFTMLPRSTTRPLYLWFVGSNSAFLRWHHQCSKVDFPFSFCASRTTFCLLLTLSSCYAGIVSSFFHSLSGAAFASGIFMACGSSQCIFCLRCDLHYFSGRDGSTLCLVDSWASTIQAYFVFGSSMDAFSLAPVPCEPDELLCILHPPKQ